MGGRTLGWGASPMIDATHWDHLLALLVGLLLPITGALQGRRRPEPVEPEPFTPSEKVALYWSNSAFLAVVAGLAILAWRVGDRSLDTLGLTVAPTHLAWGGGLAAIFLALFAADTLRQLAPSRIAETRARWRRDTPFMPATAREMRHALALVVSASVFEEIAFRGFLIAYVAHWTGDSSAGTVAAVALPALVFGICHAYQGGWAMAKIALLSGFFGAILVVTGSLWIPIALHFVVDLIAFRMGPRLMTEAAQ